MDNVAKRDIRAAVWFWAGVFMFVWAIMTHVHNNLEIAAAAFWAAAAIARAGYMVLTPPERTDDAS